MDVMELREKLHEYIETADEQELLILCTFLGEDLTHINNETPDAFENRMNKYKNSDSRVYTMQESIEMLEQHLR